MSQQTLDLYKSNTNGGLSTIDPDSQFDKSRGWTVGDQLTNTVTGRIWMCLRDDVGSAFWKPASDAVHLLRRPVNTSMWMAGLTQAPGSSTAAVTADRLYAVPFLRAGAVVNRIACNVTAAVAGNVRMGIYANDFLAGQPGAKLAETAEISTSTTGIKEGSFTDLTIPSGGAWLVALFSANPTVTIGQATGDDIVGHIDFTTPGRNLQYSFAYAALPSVYGTPNSASSQGSPLLMVRYQ